jgi:hypothetical protein
MFLWEAFGELTFEVLLLTFVCLVEEIEVLTEVEAVCEELDVLCDGVSIFPFGSKNNISTLRRADSSLSRMIHMCKNHMSVSLRVFSIPLKLKQCLPELKTPKNQLG